MKVPVEWLRAAVDIGHLSDEMLADGLTMAGLEVEEVHGVGIDKVFVTKVTPNRGDWMSIAGVARETAAVFQASLAPIDHKILQTTQSSEPVSVRSEAGFWCTRYAARVIRDVQYKPSPAYIQQRLIRAGMRPINAVVDVTNYVMLELGQPLHAFDLDKIEGGVVVRSAKPVEMLITLDGVERTLDPAILVIADEHRPIGLAGIMGGSDSEVTESTRNIFLESAHFDPGVVRRGARSLGLSTEASYRFERYVDPNVVPQALDRSAELISQITGGVVDSHFVDIYPIPVNSRTVTVRPGRVEQILGVAIDPALAKKSLERLQMTVGSIGSLLHVTVPTFRPDLTSEIDLIEEVGRMIGYDALPDTIPPARGKGGGDFPKGAFESRLRSILVGQGLIETYSHTLSSVSPFDDPHLILSRVKVRTALSAELSGLRVSLLPHLLDALALNSRHRQHELRLFETGKVFRTAVPTGYLEPRSVAAVLTGGALDYGDSKGVVENLLAALSIQGVRFIASHRHAMHPGRCASIVRGDATLGFVAELDPDMVKAELNLPSSIGRIACFELSGELLRSASEAAAVRQYHALPKYPAVTRDAALLFDRDVPYGLIEAVIVDSAGPILESVSLLSIYAGERIADDKKSVAVRLTLQDRLRTLTDADAEKVLSDVRQTLAGSLGAQER